MQLIYGSNSTTIEWHNDAGAILVNGSFETPDVPPYTTTYDIGGGSWLFNSRSGIADVSGAGASSTFPGSDDFNDRIDDGWIREDPIGTGSWTLTNGSYRIRSSPSPAPGSLGPGRAASLRTNESYAGFYVAADLVSWDN